MNTLDLVLVDVAATDEWAGVLAAALGAEPLAEQSFVIHLSGDLGAGKTALARGILRGLEFPGAVKSPTFTLMETYNLTKFVVYHFDLYRFLSGDQWYDAGFDEILAGPGLVLLEWPEKAAGALSRPDLLLELVATGDGEERRMHATAHTEGGRRCLSRVAAAVSDLPRASWPGAGC